MSSFRIYVPKQFVSNPGLTNPLTVPLDMGNNAIINLPPPTLATDIVTKSYVDSHENFILMSFRADVISASSGNAIAASYFSWDNTRYSSLENPVCIYHLVSKSTDVFTIELWGSSSLIATDTVSGVFSGIRSFIFTKPTSDQLLSIRVFNTGTPITPYAVVSAIQFQFTS